MDVSVWRYSKHMDRPEVRAEHAGEIIFPSGLVPTQDPPREADGRSEGCLAV